VCRRLRSAASCGAVCAEKLRDRDRFDRRRRFTAFGTRAAAENVAPKHQS
jgi:hypothetical protein